MEQVSAPIAVSDPVEAVRQWFALMGQYCASVDYDGAESIFADDVVSFGTMMDIVRGRKALREGQWESIWGNITGFKMDLGQCECVVGVAIRRGEWSPGRPLGTTAITSRFTVRAGRL